MVPGLLWFDDDARTPVAHKIAQAAARYRERVGYEPTVCQLNPAQLSASLAIPPTGRRASRRRAPAEASDLPSDVRLLPTTQIPRNHFLIGVGADETPVPLPRVSDNDDEEHATAPQRPARRKAAPHAPRTDASTVAPHAKTASRAPVSPSVPALPPVSAAPKRSRRVSAESQAAAPANSPPAPLSHLPHRTRTAKPAVAAVSTPASQTPAPTAAPKLKSKAELKSVPKPELKPATTVRTRKAASNDARHTASAESDTPPAPRTPSTTRRAATTTPGTPTTRNVPPASVPAPVSVPTARERRRRSA